MTALRSFEAAARNQSFTRAAVELFVSQAAISRQVRDLEQLLGKPLFERHPQRVELTVEGARLQEILTSAFDAMETGMETLSEGVMRPEVTLSVEPSFASMLLISRLKKFSDDFPQIGISVVTSQRLIEFKAHEPRLAIRYGVSDGIGKIGEAQHLFDVELVAVIARELLESGPALKRPEDFLKYRLLDEVGETNWKDWMLAAGVTTVATDSRLSLDHMGLVLQAVLQSQGVAILDRCFAAPYLETGALVQPFDVSVRNGAYWIAAMDFSKLSRPESELVNWLKREFGQG
jgi:LysR family glycine cleavage system transcriptional activator